MIIIILVVLIDPWCRHYYYRYVVGVPPDNYGITTIDVTPIDNGSTNNTNSTPDPVDTTTNSTNSGNNTTTDGGVVTNDTSSTNSTSRS